MAELDSCDIDYMVCKFENIDCLAHYRKISPTPDLVDGNFVKLSSRKFMSSTVIQKFSH